MSGDLVRVGPEPGPATGVTLFARPRGHRFAVVADANALIADSMRRTRGLFSIMPVLAQRRVITLVTAEHIDAKVYERLPEACTNAHVDLAEATATYETVYRPLLRLVAAGELMLHDNRVNEVALADEEDVPVAQLAVLLAPSLVLTQDSDLLDAGIGVKEWADALILLKEFSEVDQMMWKAADGAALGSAIIEVGVSEFVKLLRRSEVAFGITLGVSLAFAYMYRHKLRDAPAKLKQRSTPAFNKAMVGMANAFERWDAADRRAGATLVAPEAEESLEALAARVLLQCEQPIGGTAVHSQLPYEWRENASVDEVMTVLREQPPFELVRGRGWMLGHRPSPRTLRLSG